MELTKEMSTWELAEIMYTDRLETQTQEEEEEEEEEGGGDEEEEGIRREVSEGRAGQDIT